MATSRTTLTSCPSSVLARWSLPSKFFLARKILTKIPANRMKLDFQGCFDQRQQWSLQLCRLRAIIGRKMQERLRDF